MQIALTRDEALHYGSLYDESRYDDGIEKILAAAAARGFMDLTDLVAVARWKWKGGRTTQLVTGNSDIDVREITGVRFQRPASACGSVRYCHWLGSTGRWRA